MNILVEKNWAIFASKAWHGMLCGLFMIGMVLGYQFGLGIQQYIQQIQESREQVSIDWMAKQQDKEYGAAVLITYQKCLGEKTETNESCLSIIGDDDLYVSVLDAQDMIPLPNKLSMLRAEWVYPLVDAFVVFSIG